MIIPIRCMTCGKVLADKWNKYLELVKKLSADREGSNVLDVTADNIEKSPEGLALDQLKIIRYCCRKHMLSHVELA